MSSASQPATLLACTELQRRLATTYRRLFKGSPAISVRLKYDIGPSSSPASDPAISYGALTRVTLDYLRRRRRLAENERLQINADHRAAGLRTQTSLAALERPPIISRRNYTEAFEFVYDFCCYIDQ